MKALVLAPLAPTGLERLRASMPVVYESWTDTRRLYSPEELAQQIREEEVSILVLEADFVFEEVFRDAPGLRFVGVCRAAVNHVEVESATEHGVVVVNTPGRTAQGVAELTLGLMLSLARRIPQAHRYVMDGSWQDPVEPYLSLRGQELEGKVLGVVGLGAIGRRVARLGRAFGMTVVAHDPYVAPPSPRRRGLSLVNLEEVLKASDFLSLHASPPEDGEPVINGPQLARMKPTAFLVNTASPSLVDSRALVEALREHRIAGAALDVHDTSPLPQGSPFLSMENVVLTPHIGGATDGTLERHTRMMVEDVLRFSRGRKPRNMVNPLAWRSRAR